MFPVHGEHFYFTGGDRVRLAVVGATGEVGRMMLRKLEEESVNAEVLDLYASSRSAGSYLEFQDSKIRIQRSMKTTSSEVTTTRCSRPELLYRNTMRRSLSLRERLLSTILLHLEAFRSFLWSPDQLSSSGKL